VSDGRQHGTARVDPSRDAALANRVAPLRSRVPSLVAWVVRAVSLLSLLSLFTRSGVHRREVQDALVDGATIAVVITLAAVMLVVARGIARRKRRAWRIVLGLVLVAALLYLRGHNWVAAGLNLGMAALLIWTRGEFWARSEPSSRWLALRAGVLTGAVAFGAGLALTARTAPTASRWSRRPPADCSGSSRTCPTGDRSWPT
jgi:lysyl-tRNA synthetase class 2